MDLGLYEQVARLILAILLGGLIGLERERKHKPTGFRTLILISIGSCLVTILATSGLEGDAIRIISGVMTGIGFLGAGAIVISGGSVVGLTSAASVWLVAALGTGAGLGEYQLTVITAILAFLILRINFFKPME